MPSLASSVRVLTYNVHGFVGSDGVYDLERVARVIESSEADVIALQEVDFGAGAKSEPAAVQRLAERLAMQAHFTSTRASLHGHIGNAVLSPHRFHLVAEGMLPSRHDEARAVQWLRISTRHFQLELMNTHLSINPRDRSAQIQALLGAEWLIRAKTELPLVICGDLNASPWSGVYRKLSRHLRDVQCGRARRRRTWPSRLPLLRIDHIFVSEHLSVQACSVLDHELARRASDHLPLLADLSLGPGAGS